MARTNIPETRRVSGAAVKTKTGKDWTEWFALLDRSGARKMGHTEMAALLYDKLKCPGWWNQMVANAYEVDRGLRKKHEKPAGFEISRSKTIAAATPLLYSSWIDAKKRKAWLKEDGLMVRKATANKCVRITWRDGKTHVTVSFYPKGKDKCQVVVQHGKLSSAAAAEKMKTYWEKKLSQLQAGAEA